MDMTYQNKTDQINPEKTARTPGQAVLGSVSNSAMLSSLGAPDDPRGNSDALAAAVMG